jgi:hypothetical protein
MKFAVHAVLSLSLVCAHGAISAAPAAAPATAVTPAHVQAVQDLLAAMHVEKVLNGVAARSRYSNEAQRQAVYAKIDKTPPADIYRRLAPPLAPVISQDTAVEMTRFYSTPYGKQVIHKRYNSGAQIQMPGMRMGVAPEEQKARRDPAYVQASQQLADAEPAIDREAFKLLQLIDKEKR